MKRMHWLTGLALAVAMAVAGCGGTAQKPAPPVVPQAPQAPPAPAESSPAQAVAFEVLQEPDLPAALAGWRSLKQPPESVGSARVGDHLYVLVTAGPDSVGAGAIAVSGVDLVEKPTPIFTVRAVLSPGKPVAEGFPRAYIRIPYPSGRPVPGVLAHITVEAARGESSPATDPSTPVSSPATPATVPAQPAPTPPAPEPASGSLAVTPLSPSALPAALSAWRQSTVQVPGGAARFLDGALYLMVSGGQRNTGGYGVEILSVERQGDALLVTAHLRTPAPGAMVTQAITYPKAYAKVALQGTGEPQVIVNWK
ncbi:MAG: protease complex subunit PrcB family protein [Bacillota bacterium]